MKVVRTKTLAIAMCMDAVEQKIGVLGLHECSMADFCY
jgi:hypothetical protein